MLLSNQIAGIFDHYYLWTESKNALDFLKRNINQWHSTLGTNTFI